MSLLLSASFPLASHRSWPSSRQSLDVISEDPERKELQRRRMGISWMPQNSMEISGVNNYVNKKHVSYHLFVAYESM